jgi:hypothetical protein
MKKMALSVMVALLALGAGGCRELVKPAAGYIIIDNILSPVQIRTKGLEGTGWIRAYTTDGTWTVIHLSPSGSFAFNDVLPFDAKIWHCDPASGSEGCVAVLQAGDDEGYLKVNGRAYGKFHVCTANYLQKMGRKHCGERDFAKWDGTVDESTTEDLSYYGTTVLRPNQFPDVSADYLWRGDAMSRFVSGYHEWQYVNSWHPPSESQTAGAWNEYPGLPAQQAFAFPGDTNVSVDIGACAIFLPWEWKDRIPNSFWTTVVGLQTAPIDANGYPIPNPDGTTGRGLAELLLDGVMDSAESRQELNINVKLWLDALTGIDPRPDISPELHFTVTDEGKREVCLKSYWNVDNDIQSNPDAFYRIDQAILGTFISLFGIGDCKTHPMSMRYCGEVGIQNGKGAFNLDEDSIYIAVEPYSVFKPSCNNEFIPSLKNGFVDAIKTAGALNMSDGMAQLTDAVSDLLGVIIRRMEITPTGMYLVTADSIDDSQYGVGTCLPDLQSPNVTPNLQPEVLNRRHSSRGITRF